MTANKFTPFCPLPFGENETVQLAHGGGGRLMQQLIEGIFLPAFDNPLIRARHDGALISPGIEGLAFTTDSYVIHPLFFPGGDIGRLAVYGTVNDLAMCGARPQYLSAGFILEEGLPVSTLRRIVHAMKAAAEETGVQIVTGDTKVVDRGKGDGVFINTAGIGRLESARAVGPDQVQDGDVILLSGDIGRHGIAVMAVREGLAFETTIESDLAPLSALVLSLFEAGIAIHCLRDLTRGGLASALNEIAEAGSCVIQIEEAVIPVQEQVRGACEILGFDPLYVANEGRFIAFVPKKEAEKALNILRAHPLGATAADIGFIEKPSHGAPAVLMRSCIGSTRIVDRLSGEQLPRIC